MGYAKTNLDLKTSLLSLSQKFDNEIEAGFKVEKIEYNTRDFYQKAIGSNLYDPRQTNYGLYLGYTYKF